MVKQIFFTDATVNDNRRYKKGYIHEITYQGQFLHWRVIKPDEPERLPNLRGKCESFSKNARLRMLSTMARIDWKEVGRTLFVTLTYPSVYVDTPTRKLSQHLHVFRRGVEQHLRRRIAILWRMEWVERKTGEYRHFIFPHYHLLLFSVPWIHARTTNRIWRNAIGHRGYCRTETTRMRSMKGAIYYVAKYASKESSSLVYGAYLNNKPSGRQWGILRKHLIPFGERFVRTFRDDVHTASAYVYAKTMLKSRLQKASSNFRLFGLNAEEIGQLIHGLTIDGELIEI